MPEPSPTAAAARTLVIGLEGGLLRSELLMEALVFSRGRMLVRFGAGGRPGIGALTDILACAEKVYRVADRVADHAAGIAAHLGFDGVVASADLAAGDLPVDRDIIARVSARGDRRAGSAIGLALS